MEFDLSRKEIGPITGARVIEGVRGGLRAFRKVLQFMTPKRLSPTEAYLQALLGEEATPEKKRELANTLSMDAPDPDTSPAIIDEKLAARLAEISSYRQRSPGALTRSYQL